MLVMHCLEEPTDLSPAYLRQIKQVPLLDAEEERQLAARIATGDREARDQLVRAHLYLVIRIARRYIGRGLGLQDLIEEGNVGLLRAVPRFDPTRGVRFYIYATFWIRQAIRRALIFSTGTVRIPTKIVGLLVRWRKATAQLQEELGRTPEREEIARRLNLSPRRLALVRQALQVRGAGFLTAHQGEGNVLEELLADHRTELPERHVLRTEALTHLRARLAELGEREAAVLRLRFGLSAEEPSTLQEIGDRLGMTREGVRKIERKALSKLSACLQAG
jgi:RNA polymerase primary sigma factor